jgi:hypothetical protein
MIQEIRLLLRYVDRYLSELLWPRRTRKHVPVTTSHNRNVLSALPVTNRLLPRYSRPRARGDGWRTSKQKLTYVMGASSNTCLNFTGTNTDYPTPTSTNTDRYSTYYSSANRGVVGAIVVVAVVVVVAVAAAVATAVSVVVAAVVAVVAAVVATVAVWSSRRSSGASSGSYHLPPILHNTRRRTCDRQSVPFKLVHTRRVPAIPHTRSTVIPSTVGERGGNGGSGCAWVGMWVSEGGMGVVSDSTCGTSSRGILTYVPYSTKQKNGPDKLPLLCRAQHSYYVSVAMQKTHLTGCDSECGGEYMLYL